MVDWERGAPETDPSNTAKLVRIVTFRPQVGREGELRRFLRSTIRKVNLRFGALDVWCLSAESEMAILSWWASAEVLDAMRTNASYKKVFLELELLSEGLVDKRFEIISGRADPPFQ